MSAICGLFALGDAPFRPELLGRMMQALEKHGPDGRASWHDDRAGLGHQMMHVTPESIDERLPLHHAESRSALTADARLDNREGLLHALGIPTGRDLADSAIILKAFQRWGTECADRLVGEFAIAIWDAGSNRLHCFTDPMGIRPLFCMEVPGRYFAFASEVRALLSLAEGTPRIDQRRLAMLGVSAMTFYLEPERTCFENIERVPAATVLTVERNRRRAEEYWRPDPGKRLFFKSDAECREAFQDVFLGAVKSRMRSAFPVASMLSGGLDSSAIVGAADAILGNGAESLITLSSVPAAGTEGKVRGEREYIDLFSDRDNLQMHYVSAPGCGPADELERLVETGSLCSWSYQHFLYTALVRKAREHGARIILDGHGGEHSASCYPSGFLAELLLTGRLRRLAGELRHLEPNRRIRWAAIKREVLRPLLPWSLLKAINRHQRFKAPIRYPILPAFVQQVLGSEADHIRDSVLRMLAECPDHRKNMVRGLLQERSDLRQRSHAGFVDYHQARFTYPYLDKRVIEFSLAIDGQYKYQDGTGRRLLRLGMAGLVPERILSRESKAPFSPDYHLRYVKQKNIIFNMIYDLSRNNLIKKVVDFEGVFAALDSTPVYRMERPMAAEADSQFTVPYALYLCYFLERFG